MPFPASSDFFTPEAALVAVVVVGLVVVLSTWLMIANIDLANLRADQGRRSSRWCGL